MPKINPILRAMKYRPTTTQYKISGQVFGSYREIGEAYGINIDQAKRSVQKGCLPNGMIVRKLMIPREGIDDQIICK